MSNAYSLAKFGFDTAEDEPAKNLQRYNLQNLRQQKSCKEEIANFANSEVQGDPYAPPSWVRIRVPAAKAGFPAEYVSKSSARNAALADFLTRSPRRVIKTCVRLSENGSS